LELVHATSVFGFRVRLRVGEFHRLVVEREFASIVIDVDR
jgi:hypothetical protein